MDFAMATAVACSLLVALVDLVVVQRTAYSVAMERYLAAVAELLSKKKRLHTPF